MKPEILAWTLLFVVLFAIVWRACSAISRRLRRPTAETPAAKDADVPAAFNAAGSSAAAPSSKPIAASVPPAVPAAARVEPVVEIRKPSQPDPQAVSASPPAVSAVHAAAARAAQAEMARTNAETAKPASVTATTAKASEHDSNDDVRAASDAAPVKMPYLAAAPSPAAPPAHPPASAAVAQAAASDPYSPPSIAATLGPRMTSPSAPPVVQAAVAVAPLAADAAARLAANLLASGNDGTPTLPDRSVVTRPMLAATRDPAAPVVQPKPAPIFKPTDTSLPDDARPFATPNTARTLYASAVTSAAPAAQEMTATVSDSVTPDVKATVPPGTAVSDRRPPQPRTFADQPFQFTGTRPDVRATLAPPVNDPFLQAPAATQPPVPQPEAQTSKPNTAKGQTTSTPATQKLRSLGGELRVPKLKLRKQKTGRGLRQAAAPKQKPARKRLRTWSNVAAVKLKSFRRSAALRVLQNTQELRVLGHETAKLISFQHRSTKIVGAPSKRARIDVALEP